METYEKKHSMALTEVFNSREDLNNHERECVHFKASYLAIVSAFKRYTL